MNEVFVAEPSSCETLGDLRYLLGLFGPQTGRYLASYPTTWHSLLEEHFNHLPPVESERLKTILRRAQEQVAIVVNKSLPWEPTYEWIDNALRLPPSRINQVIASPKTKKNGATTVAELDLPKTAEERIKSTPTEYVRVCKTLLIVSPELIFVDPYLTPCRTDFRGVFEGMLEAAKLGKCRRIICWAKATHVLDTPGFSWQEVEDQLRAMLLRVQWPKNWGFEYRLVDDTDSTEKMHGRFLVSIKGAIRLDQGFQSLTKERAVDVSPVAGTIHSELLRLYLEDGHDMVRTHHFNTSP